MNFLMIGDIYSAVGRKMLNDYLPKLMKEKQLDFVIANGENISHGKGIMKKHYMFLKNLGVNVITSGNHIFKNKEVFDYIDNVDDLLRPANMYKGLPGKGTFTFSIKNKQIRVTNLIGKSFMDPCNNPYEVMDEILKNDDSDINIVDFHAEATAEKLAFATNYDGKITFFAGTHTHVQTADNKILPKGTGYITDLGMTGCYESIIGAKIESVLIKEKTGLITKFEPAEGKGQFCGVVVNLHGNKVKTIERIYIYE